MLTCAALLAGIPLIDGPGALVICFIVAILALVIGWFAVQARQWWWAPPMVAIAVLWNPVYPFAFDGPVWLTAHIVAAVLVITAGLLITIPRQQPGGRHDR
jgi:hypothetical protein